MVYRHFSLLEEDILPEVHPLIEVKALIEEDTLIEVKPFLEASCLLEVKPLTEVKPFIEVKNLGFIVSGLLFGTLCALL